MVSDAYRFIIPLLIIALALFAVSGPWAAGLPALLAVFVSYFFRNPARRVPPGAKLVVSPADGRIVKVAAVGQGLESRRQVSIFLNILDVHVNRAPIDGELESLEYRRGRFKVASDDEASRVNEQNILTIRGQDATLVVKQIAGLIARRVVCWKKAGQNMERGEVIGLIRFGSRVDLLLPEDSKVIARVGDRVKGGSSVIAELK
jgi:phosphatidylserine decarboxylase